MKEDHLVHAPTPGVGHRAEAATAAKRIAVITLGWTGETYRIAVNNVPLEHRMAVRKQTGMAFNQYVGGPDSIDVDSIAVLVWVARRMQGEASLSWAQFARTWPPEPEPGSIDVWIEDTQGRKVDEDNKVIDDTPALDVAEVGDFAVSEPDDDVEECDDPQS